MARERDTQYVRDAPTKAGCDAVGACMRVFWRGIVRPPTVMHAYLCRHGRASRQIRGPNLTFEGDKESERGRVQR